MDRAQPAAQIARAIASYFPKLGSDVLARALARYQARQVWGRDPILPEDGFARLRQRLLSSGSIGRPARYEACVDNTLAQRAVAERPA
jgi:NitT/TauT family transport system substrate-binding protein